MQKYTALRPEQINYNLPNLSVTFLLLVMLYITLTLTGNAIFSKILQIHHFSGVGAEVVMPSIFLIEDVMAEVYGYKIARTLLWLVMLAEFIFSTLILLIIHLPSPAYWHLQPAFNSVFDKLIQVGPVAIIAVLLGRFTNIYLITKFKILTKGKYFWFRSVFSTIAGSAVIDLLYYGVGFWGIYPLIDIYHMMLSAFLLRVSYAVIGGFPALLIVLLLKKIEKVDVYDVGTNFNPFIISLADKT